MKNLPSLPIKKNMALVRIDPDASSILRSSCRAVEAILAKRKALDEEGLQNMPLFVPMGEIHTSASHMIHHIAVMQQLLEANEKIAFASELPFDYLAKQYCAFAGTEPVQEIMKPLYFRDPTGESVRKYMFAYAHAAAGYAFNFLQDFLLQKKIPSRLSDTSRISFPQFDYQFIDPKDGTAHKSLVTRGQDPLNLCATVSEAGVDVRNYHMMQHMIHLAINEKPRIVLQQCGQAHVVGSHAYKIENSLSSQFKQRNLPVLSLQLNGNFHKDMPSEDELKLQGHDVLINYDMPQDQFPYIEDGVISVEEKEYTDRLLDSTGLRSDFGSAAAIEARRKQAQKDTEALFCKWDVEFGKNTKGFATNKTRAIAANAVFHLLTGPSITP